MNAEKSPLGRSERLQRTYEETIANAGLVQAMLEASEDCIKLLDPEGRLQFMSPGGLSVMEIEDFSPFEGCAWLDFWSGPHFEEARLALKEAREGRTARFQGFANTAKGNRRYWHVRVSPINGKDGRVEGLLSIYRDVTALRELQDRQQVVVNEMRHRAKNTLTIVQAIAAQTLRNAGQEASGIGRTFGQRIQALARSYDALVLRDWTAASLRDLISATVEPFNDAQNSRIAIDGPNVEVGASSALLLGLAVNELAANAAKYGALSNRNGKVEVAWTVSGEPARLKLRWQESGGPTVEPPTRRGVGSTLIRRALPRQLRGSVNLQFLPGGVVCDVDAPLD